MTHRQITVRCRGASHFKIYPLLGSNYVDIIVTPTLSAMYEVTESIYRRVKSDLTRIGTNFYAVYLPVGTAPCLGVVTFCGKNISNGLVAHELLHVVREYVADKKRLKNKNWDREEIECRALESLVDQFHAKLHDPRYRKDKATIL